MISHMIMIVLQMPRFKNLTARVSMKISIKF